MEGCDTNISCEQSARARAGNARLVAGPTIAAGPP